MKPVDPTDTGSKQPPQRRTAFPAVNAAPNASPNQIGERLSALRVAHGTSMRELSRRSGVSASLISEAERGLVEPSLGVLKRLASVLDVSMTYFFSSPGGSGESVIRRDERKALRNSLGVRHELAISEKVRSIEPVYARLEPGAGVTDGAVQHEGEEWGMVLTGRLKVWVGAEVYFLDPGDTIHFPASVPHRVANPTDQVIEYLWVTVPATHRLNGE